MVNPLTKFGTVVTGILAPFALSLGNPTEAIGSNKVDLQIINPVQPTTLVERGSKSRLFNNPAALVAEAPREAIANSQGDKRESSLFRTEEEKQKFGEGVTETRRQAVETARDAQRRIDENNANIERRNQEIQNGVNSLSGRNPLDLLK